MASSTDDGFEETSLPARLTCNQCQDSVFDAVKLLPCGHSLCGDCGSEDPANCPTCGQEVHSTQYNAPLAEEVTRMVERLKQTRTCKYCKNQVLIGQEESHACAFRLQLQNLQRQWSERAPKVSPAVLRSIIETALQRHDSDRQRNEAIAAAVAKLASDLESVRPPAAPASKAEERRAEGGSGIGIGNGGGNDDSSADKMHLFWEVDPFKQWNPDELSVLHARILTALRDARALAPSQDVVSHAYGRESTFEGGALDAMLRRLRVDVQLISALAKSTTVQYLERAVRTWCKKGVGAVVIVCIHGDYGTLVRELVQEGGVDVYCVHNAAPKSPISQFYDSFATKCFRIADLLGSGGSAVDRNPSGASNPTQSQSLPKTTLPSAEGSSPSSGTLTQGTLGRIRYDRNNTPYTWIEAEQGGRYHLHSSNFTGGQFAEGLRVQFVVAPSRVVQGAESALYCKPLIQQPSPNTTPSPSATALKDPTPGSTPKRFVGTLGIIRRDKFGKRFTRIIPSDPTAPPIYLHVNHFAGDQQQFVEGATVAYSKGANPVVGTMAIDAQLQVKAAEQPGPSLPQSGPKPMPGPSGNPNFAFPPSGPPRQPPIPQMPDLIGLANADPSTSPLEFAVGRAHPALAISGSRISNFAASGSGPQPHQPLCAVAASGVQSGRHRFGVLLPDDSPRRGVVVGVTDGNISTDTPDWIGRHGCTASGVALLLDGVLCYSHHLPFPVPQLANSSFRVVTVLIEFVAGEGTVRFELDGKELTQEHHRSCRLKADRLWYPFVALDEGCSIVGLSSPTPPISDPRKVLSQAMGIPDDTSDRTGKPVSTRPGSSPVQPPPPFPAPPFNQNYQASLPDYSDASLMRGLSGNSLLENRAQPPLGPAAPTAFPLSVPSPSPGTGVSTPTSSSGGKAAPALHRYVGTMGRVKEDQRGLLYTHVKREDDEGAPIFLHSQHCDGPLSERARVSFVIVANDRKNGEPMAVDAQLLPPSPVHATQKLNPTAAVPHPQREMLDVRGAPIQLPPRAIPRIEVGKVKFTQQKSRYSEKYYGFIVPEGGGTDVFFVGDVVEGSPIFAGDFVEYQERESDRNNQTQATWVRRRMEN